MMLVRLYQQGVIDLFFADEVGFCLTPTIPYGWQMKRQQIKLVPRDSKRLSVFGLMSLDNRFAAYPTEATTTGEFIVQCMDDFIKTIDKPTVVVLDNAPIHRCQVVYEQIEQWQAQDLYIFFLPKYSPHLNYIEILWRKMKYEWLKPEHYKSWGRLTKAVKSILKNFGTEYKIRFQNSIIPENFCPLT